MLVWPDHNGRNSWGRGGPWGYGTGFDYVRLLAMATLAPAQRAWVGTGVLSSALGAFDIAFPTATMATWPTRCAYALQLDYDGGGSTDLLIEGHLHVTYSIPRSVSPVIMPGLTDPKPRRGCWTDVETEAIYLAGGPS